MVIACVCKQATRIYQADGQKVKMMKLKARYHVIPDKVGNGVTILDTETGVIQYPACWQDLAAYYYYLVERGRIEEAQKLLAESMAGNKPITRMLMAVSASQSVSQGPH